MTDTITFGKFEHLFEPEHHYTWRSGVKHDCSKIMELKRDIDGYRNGFEELVAIESDFLFPMFKSSDIGNARGRNRGFMLVTQAHIGDDTSIIRSVAPQTWRYLNKHAETLERRGSSIYRGKPPFSVFGVGEYSFAPWKVAISGFYKRLEFVLIGPIDGRPPVLDDTVYFLPCWSEDEAKFLEKLLNSEPSRQFLGSMIHWPDKRPITSDILRRLSIKALAAELSQKADYDTFVRASAQRAKNVGLPRCFTKSQTQAPLLQQTFQFEELAQTTD